MHDNIEQLDDGSWKATCPFDGEEFEADTKIEALSKEGAHRAEKHIESSEESSNEEQIEARNIVDSWKRGDREVAASH